jgi:hypothetical protein
MLEQSSAVNWVRLGNQIDPIKMAEREGFELQDLSPF